MTHRRMRGRYPRVAPARRGRRRAAPSGGRTPRPAPAARLVSAAATDELDWLETLNALRAEGKIDQIGVSIRDYRPDEGVVLAQLGLVGVDPGRVQHVGAATARLDALFPAGAATGTAFIGRVPFDSGALVGHWNEDTYAGWAPGTVPHTLFRGDRFPLTSRACPVGSTSCAAPCYPTLAEAAIRYSLSPDLRRHSDPRNEEPRRGGHERRLLRRCALPRGTACRTGDRAGWPRNFYK